MISGIRNNVNGRICRLTIDNDKGYYWRGRVFIEDFDRSRGLGSFTLNVPSAEPYKYSVNSSSEPWLWDPFNFETDMITYEGAWDVNGSLTETIPSGHMPTVPQFVVNDLVGEYIGLSVGGFNYRLYAGTNTIPEIIVGSYNDVTLTFTGYGKVQCVYRSGSL